MTYIVDFLACPNPNPNPKKYLSILDVSPRWTWPFFDGGFDRPEAEKTSIFKSTKSFDDVLINIKT